ncbi:MAG: protoheme IX farnesyltransferase [Ignavibacteria bacterium]|nr:protoheme IX farnesyltransferase [Ignavibacteria bacterium]
MKEFFNILFTLIKFRITSFVMVTTAFGYILYAGKFEWDMVYPLIGIFLLASASAVINQIQEEKFDRLMVRTKNRPIPANKIGRSTSLIFASMLFISGLILLITSSGLLASLFGLIALIWYNFVYTPLKRKNSFAVVPGSLIGAIPPLVGWISAGGDFFDKQIFAVSFFFFVWQIPHFWLLSLFYDDDYKKAGFASLSTLFQKEQIIRLTFIWIISLAVMSLILPLFNLVDSFVIKILLVLTSIWLGWNAVRLFSISELSKSKFMFAFKDINIFALVIVLLVSIDKVLLIK